MLLHVHTAAPSLLAKWIHRPLAFLAAAGEWVDNRRTGRGTLFYANGDIFVGE